MKRTITYYLLSILLASVVTAGCNQGKRINNRLTLWKNDKIPYGTWYAYENLGEIFPSADITLNKKSPDQFRDVTTRNFNRYSDDYSYNSHKTVYIIIARQVLPDDKEVAALLEKVSNGEHIFISSLSIGLNLLDTLKLSAAYYSGYFNQADSMTVHIKKTVSDDTATYTYPGLSLDNYFDDMDASITTVLGSDEKGRPNFVKFSYESGGTIYLHLAPTAFTNFFLLHGNNKSYYDNALSYLPQNAEVVRWDEYFRYSVNGSGNDGGAKGFSALGWISKQPGLAWAMWLLLALLLLVYLFESKRKQRFIPVIKPLKNASLDFVKTVGRLYFQRKDNKDLVHKMNVHFLDHVRNRYNIRTSVLDEEFAQRLSYKSGYDAGAVKNLLYYMRFTLDQPNVSDEELLRLNNKLDNFYKHT